MMKNRNILLGVTGGIAAYKAADLASKLVQQKANVTVVMTDAAKQFVGKTTFEAITQKTVYTKLFEPKEHFLGPHIGLARNAELLIIAPATANFLAKMAHGFADDLLSTLVLATTVPTFIAPAMNTEMWNKPAVQRNLKQLKKDGIQTIQPGEGWLSCGQVGAGRMAEPTEIIEAIQKNFIP